MSASPHRYGRSLTPRRAARLLGGLLALGLLVAAGAYVLGPWVFGLLYKERYNISSWTMAGLGWSGIALAATMLAVAAMVARKKTSHVLGVWATVSATGLILLICVPGDIVLRAVIGATAAPTLGLITATALLLIAQDENHRSA